MAKTTVDVLIGDLCKRLGWDSTASTQPRADVLTELDRAEKYILQRYSLSFLTDPTQTISLSNATDNAAAPSTMDTSKDVTLRDAGADAEMQYVPPDEWYETGQDNYGNWITDRPFEFTLLGDGSGNLRIYFRPQNTSGTTLSYSIIFQRLPIALIDASAGTGSTSLLPEGFEKTLLFRRAEGVLKRAQRKPGYQELLDEVERDLEVFYGQFRATREKPWIDREQQERKISRSTLADGT